MGYISNSVSTTNFEDSELWVLERPLYRIQYTRTAQVSITYKVYYICHYIEYSPF